VQIKKSHKNEAKLSTDCKKFRKFQIFLIDFNEVIKSAFIIQHYLKMGHN